jgi:phosphatidylglycerophosphate synthase
MAHTGHAPASQTPRGARRAALAGDLVAGSVVAALAGAATWRLTGSSASYPFLVVGIWVTLAGVVALRLPSNAPGPGMGAANRVTLFRGAMAVAVFALAVQLVALDGLGAWWVIVLSTVILVLDGIDGRIARRTGTETAFGARFDMEVDAALIMALSVLVWAHGRVGAWVLLVGAMRYLFVAASLVWPALAAELPPSRRRKVVCVVQGVVLLVALGPVVPGWLAVGACAGGLAMLTYSFAVDVRWAFTAHAAQRGATSRVADTG